MADHGRFGGSWTEVKLGCLRKYLRAYRQIFTKNEKARHFTTWYVDAFAGTGSRLISTATESRLFAEVYQDEDTAQYHEGSVRIALNLPDPFDNYLFIEKSKSRVTKLKGEIQKDFPALFSRCDFRQGEANEVLQRWCVERNWYKERAVVFLDPYGMQVEWKTVEKLAKTQAVDLWYLFPLGVGVSRLLTHDGQIEEAWQRRLDLVFGTPDWKTRFYEIRHRQTLFGDDEEVIRTATEENIRTFIQERLNGCFAKTANGLILRNSKSNPMYLLCFAAANERGAATALRIAQHILND